MVNEHRVHRYDGGFVFATTSWSLGHTCVCVSLLAVNTLSSVNVSERNSRWRRQGHHDDIITMIRKIFKIFSQAFLQGIFERNFHKIFLQIFTHFLGHFLTLSWTMFFSTFSSTFSWLFAPQSDPPFTVKNPWKSPLENPIQNCDSEGIFLGVEFHEKPPSDRGSHRQNPPFPFLYINPYDTGSIFFFCEKCALFSIPFHENFSIGENFGLNPVAK